MTLVAVCANQPSSKSDLNMKVSNGGSTSFRAFVTISVNACFGCHFLNSTSLRQHNVFPGIPTSNKALLTQFHPDSISRDNDWTDVFWSKSYLEHDENTDNGISWLTHDLNCAGSGWTVLEAQIFEVWWQKFVILYIKWKKWICSHRGFLSHFG